MRWAVSSTDGSHEAAMAIGTIAFTQLGPDTSYVLLCGSLVEVVGQIRERGHNVNQPRSIAACRTTASRHVLRT